MQVRTNTESLVREGVQRQDSLFKCVWFKKFLQLFGKKTDTDMESTVAELEPELKKAESDLSSHVSKDVHNVVAADKDKMTVHWLIYAESDSNECIEQLDTIHRNLENKFHHKVLNGICQKCNFHDMIMIRTDKMPADLD